jgi:hypothetical protein
MFFFFGYPLLFLFPLFFVIFGIRLLARLLGKGQRSNFTRVPPHDNLVNHYIPDFFDSRALESAAESYEVKVFKLAYRLKGRLTVSDLVIETGLPVVEAEQLVQQMVDGSRVKMEVDDRGMVLYEFPEIIARFEGPSDSPAG